jgi:hypothetical protein
MLREEPLPFSRWLGFWSTADYPALTSIWWFEGQGVTPFWRPLPSLLIEGSVRLFGERAFPLHLLSLVVHSLVGATLFLLVRRLTGRPLVALLAGLFFLSCEDHTMGAGWGTLWCVLVPGIVLSATMPYVYAPAFERPKQQAASILPHIEQRNADHLLVLNTPGAMHTFYLHPIIEFHAKAGTETHVLSSMNGVMSVERRDDHSFILRADRKGWLTNVFAGILRSAVRLKPNAVYKKGILTARLVELTSDQRDVRAVRFEIDRSLNDPGVLVVHWDGATFCPVDLADLPVGKTVTLADTSGVWSSMW